MSGMCTDEQHDGIFFFAVLFICAVVDDSIGICIWPHSQAPFPSFFWHTVAYFTMFGKSWGVEPGNNAILNESTEVHNPRRDCAILTLAHETHQTSTV